MSVFNSDQIAEFHRDGYLFVRGLFSREEIGLLGETARNDHAMDKSSSTISFFSRAVCATTMSGCGELSPK